ncbi:MAG: hypothetical protein ACREQA_13530 [Candidatus Binatia bacterium]
MPKKIPGEITAKDFDDIKELLKRVLADLKQVAGAAWVSCRLNDSDTDGISPVFIGWVEDDRATIERFIRNDPDPGLSRFGDNYYSEIYERCIQNPHRVIGIDETEQKIEGDQRKMLWLSGARFLSVKAGAKHRRSIAIKVTNRCVGTLNAGFRDNPGAKVDNILRDWAERADKDLIAYLIKFDLRGPICQ